MYQEGGGTPVNTEHLLVDPAATTPSGGANYAGLTPADLLAFKTANLANLGVQPGVYQVRAAEVDWACCGVSSTGRMQ